MRDGLDHPQLHKPVCQEAQGPACVAFRGLPGGESDKCLLHVAGDDPGTPWPPVLLARNGGLKPLLDELLRHEGNRVLVDIECFGGARRETMRGPPRLRPL